MCWFFSIYNVKCDLQSRVTVGLKAIWIIWSKVLKMMSGTYQALIVFLGTNQSWGSTVLCSVLVGFETWQPRHLHNPQDYKLWMEFAQFLLTPWSRTCSTMPKAWPVYCMCMACCWPLANSLSSADAATYLGFRPNSHRNRTSNLTPISCEKNKKLSLPVANWSLISLNIWYGNVLLGCYCHLAIKRTGEVANPTCRIFKAKRYHWTQA